MFEIQIVQRFLLHLESYFNIIGHIIFLSKSNLLRATQQKQALQFFFKIMAVNCYLRKKFMENEGFIFSTKNYINYHFYLENILNAYILYRV